MSKEQQDWIVELIRERDSLGRQLDKARTELRCPVAMARADYHTSASVILIAGASQQEPFRLDSVRDISFSLEWHDTMFQGSMGLHGQDLTQALATFEKYKAALPTRDQNPVRWTDKVERE